MSQLIQTPDNRPEYVINDVSAPDNNETADRQLVLVQPMEDDLEMSDEEETEVEESERCAIALIKGDIHDKAYSEHIETQGQIKYLTRSVAEAVESVKLLRELIQTSNASEESLSEQVDKLQYTVEELSTAADYDNQMYAKVTQLAKQLGNVQKISYDNHESLQNHLQGHHKQQAGMKARIDECQANEKFTESFSLKDMVQYDQGEQIEELSNRVENLEDMSHRVERLETAATEFKAFSKSLDALEKKAANELTSFDGRMNTLETNVMDKYESLLSRLVLLEKGTASNKKVDELAIATLKIGKASAKISSFDSLVERGDDIADRIDYIQTALSSAPAAPQPRIFLKEEAAILKSYREEQKKNDNFGQDGRVVPYLSARTSIPEMWETWNSGTPSNGHLPVKDFKPDRSRTGDDWTWKAFRHYRVVAQYIEERASLLDRAPAAVAEDLDSLRRELELKPAIFAKSIVPELQNRIRSADPHKNSWTDHEDPCRSA